MRRKVSWDGARPFATDGRGKRGVCSPGGQMGPGWVPPVILSWGLQACALGTVCVRVCTHIHVRMWGVCHILQKVLSFPIVPISPM